MYKSPMGRHFEPEITCCEGGSLGPINLLESEYDTPHSGYLSILTLEVSGAVIVNGSNNDKYIVTVATGDGVSMGGSVHEVSNNVGRLK